MDALEALREIQACERSPVVKKPLMRENRRTIGIVVGHGTSYRTSIILRSGHTLYLAQELVTLDTAGCVP